MKPVIKKISRRLAAISAACFSVTTISTASAQQKIALITDHIGGAERQALLQVLQQTPGTAIDTVSLEKLIKKGTGGFHAIWYHRTDTTNIDVIERAAGSSIRNFVKQGGNLFLGMEAMPLLNTWELEKEPVSVRTDTVRDEGFGRPLGFHAFKSHPLFDGLQGGAYVSKQPSDHIVRKHGFFNEKTPQSLQVAGIDWTYITFTENNKLLLEGRHGKGRIIAAGAYLYYGSPNANHRHLALFTGNIAARLLKRDKGTKARYWQYTPLRYEAVAFSNPAIPLQPASGWKLPEASLEYKLEKAGKDFYDLAGRRILWMGRLQGGMEELWLHPFMALRDFEAGIQLPGTDSITWLNNIQPEVLVTPEFLARKYQFPGFTLQEIYTVSFDQPYAVAHYETDAAADLRITVRYATNLRYMWPYSEKATGPVQYAFHAPVNGHLFSAQSGELNTAVLYSSKPISQQMTTVPDKQQVRASSILPLSSRRPLNVYISGSDSSITAALRVLKQAGPTLNKLFLQTNEYYRKLLANHLGFETPDKDFNQGYKWAMARTDQFVQTTPGLGTALMAGFGTTARGWNGRHAISGRPGYAWYFGRDAEWSSMAINAYGGFKTVKEQLETLIRFQDLNGKIYHELTSSAVAHYDASDATPLFIVLAAHYLRYSGDTAFIRKSWPAIRLALDFCYSTDTDKDGLIENTNVGHGWIEGGPLFGAHTEFYLAGCWAATLEAMAYMSDALGEKAHTYRSQAAAVKELIDTAFWNKEKEYFYNGKMADGTYMDQSTGFATVPIYLKAVKDRKKAYKVTHRITGSLFSTDWGIRMLEENNPAYKPGSYHAGMVWPLYTGWGSLSAYGSGLYNAGFQYIMNNLLIYRQWAPGSLEETLNGEIYKPNGVCANQCWSETMVLQPAIEGMLGLETDAVHGSIKLAPAFPWDWEYTKVSNIPAGRNKVQFRMERRKNSTSYGFSTTEQVQIRFAPAFPLNTKIISASFNGKDITFQVEQEADGIRVLMDLPCNKGDQQLIIRTEGGAGVLPVVTEAIPGCRSGGLKILTQEIKDNKLNCLLEGRPGTTYTFRVWSAKPLSVMNNGKILARQNGTATIEVTLPASGQAYSRTNITLTF